jgi:hypothetical protein
MEVINTTAGTYNIRADLACRRRPLNLVRGKAAA